MRDKKFAIALGIIFVLVIVLLYLLLIAPKFQGFIISKQTEGYNFAVEQIERELTQLAIQQGFIVLGTEENPIVLVRNPELEQELKNSFQ